MSERKRARSRATHILWTGTGLLALVLVALAVAGCGTASTGTTVAGATQPNGAVTVASDIPHIVDQVEPEVVTVLTPTHGVGSGLIYNVEDIYVTLRQHRPGQKLRVEFVRGARSHEVTLTLSSKAQ
ncbi:MAG TPA: hypothetical protein VIH85_12110 [Solirubrobacteraceae bacterium]